MPPTTNLTAQQLKDVQTAYEKILEQQEKETKSAENIYNIREKILAQAKAEQEADEKKAALYESMFQIQTKEQEFKRVKVDLANKELEIEQKLEEIKQKKITGSQAEVDGLKEQLDNLNAQKATLDATLETKQEAYDLAKEQVKESEKQLELEKKINKEVEERRKKFGELIEKIGGQLQNLSKSFVDGFNIPIIGVRIQGLQEMITDVFKAPADAFKKYGFLDQYSKSIEGMRSSLRGAGVSEKEMYDAFGELNQGFSDFSSMNKKAQDSLVETTAKLGLAGFSGKTVANSMTNLTKVFGQTSAQAQATTTRIAALSLSLGQGQKVLDDFVSLSPKLAGFGSRAEEVFSKTAIAAKKLGMDAQELFGIMDQYDTFEKAANAAGELNVALGGQFVDSLELMNASLEGGPEKTLELLQKGFKDSGVEVENLTRAQVKYFASAAGMKEDQFMKVFAKGGEGVQDYIKQQEAAAIKQEELNKIAEKTQNVFQQIQNAFAQAFAKPENIKALVTMVQNIASLATKLANFLNTVKNLIPKLAILFAAGQILTFIGAVQKAGSVMALLRSQTIGVAIAKAVSLAFEGPSGWLKLAGAGVAAYAAIKGIGALTDYAVGGSGAEDLNTVQSAGDAAKNQKDNDMKAESPKQEVIQADDVVLGGGSVISGGGQTYKTSNSDTVVAAKEGGILASKLDSLIAEVKNLASRPVEVAMDGRKVNDALSKSNKYNPYTA